MIPQLLTQLPSGDQTYAEVSQSIANTTAGIKVQAGCVSRLNGESKNGNMLRFSLCYSCVGLYLVLINNH